LICRISLLCSIEVNTQNFSFIIGCDLALNVIKEECRVVLTSLSFFLSSLISSILSFRVAHKISNSVIFEDVHISIELDVGATPGSIDFISSLLRCSIADIFNKFVNVAVCFSMSLEVVHKVNGVEVT
jgi:hypothetical protein